MDYFSGLEFASGINYVLLVLLSLWFKDPKSTFYLIGFSISLILIGLIITPIDGQSWIVYTNRTYSIGAVLTLGMVLYFHLRSSEKIDRQKKELGNLSLENMQQLDTLNAAAIVSITDKKGNILMVNDLFCEISGYSREELLGKNHRLIKSNVHSAELYKGMWLTISRGQIWKGEICNRAKDGSLYWVETTISLFRNSEGEIDKYVSIRFDITERKRQSEELKLKEEELKLKNVTLIEANKELEMFSYSVSHDLKAPLRALQGFSENLGERYKDALDETGQRWLGFIKSNSERMGLLIDDILSFSKINHQQIKLQALNMTEMAREVCENEARNYDRPIEFSIENLPHSQGDYSMIRMVWQNLIGNAFKYSSKKEKIKIVITGTAGSVNSYSIKDNGVGFDMRYYDKLFGVFQRLHGNEEFSGNGVGLANVKRIITKHGGTIEAEGIPDEGAHFVFTLPNKIK